MKKLLMVLLLSALIPFMVGCFGSDSEDEAAPLVANTLNFAIAIASSSIDLPAASILAAGTTDAPYRVYVKMTGNQWTELSAYWDSSKAQWVFIGTGVPGNTLSLDSNGKLIVKITNRQGNKAVVVSLSNVDATQTGTSTAKNYLYDISRVSGTSVTFAGYSLNVSISTYVPSSGYNLTSSIPTAGATTVESSTTATGTAGQYISWTSVEITDYIGTYTLSAVSSSPTGIYAYNLNNIKFRMTFSEDVTDATTTFKGSITNITTNDASQTIDNTSNDLTLSYSNRILSVAFSKNLALTNGNTYKISVVDSSAKSGSRGMNLPMDFYFTPSSTYLSSWTGMTEDTSTEYYYASMTAATLNAGVTLNFSGPLKSSGAISNGYFRLEKYSSLAAAIAGTSPVTVRSVSTANATVNAAQGTVTMVPGSTFTSGTFYRISFESGTLYDASNKVVAFSKPIVVSVN